MEWKSRFYKKTPINPESFPAEKAAFNQKAVILMEMRWLYNWFEARIDCFRGVCAWWHITSFEVSTAKSKAQLQEAIW